MKQKPLIQTNPYLRDPEKFRKALITSVASSTAIETGAPIATIVLMLEEGEESKLLTTTQGSAR
jgi:H+/Cl- antiporter ClcA